MTVKDSIQKYLYPLLLCGIFMIIPIVSVVSARPLGSLVPGFALLLLGFDFLIFKKRPIFDRNLALLLGCIAALCLSSVLWSDWPAKVLSQSANILYVFSGGYALILLARQAGDSVKDKTLGYLLLAFAISCLLIMIETIANSPLYRMAHGMGFDEHIPDSLTNHALVVFSLLIWPIMHFLRGKGQKGRAQGAMALWVILVFFLGKSSSATLALLAGCSVFVLLPLAPRVINRLTSAFSVLIIFIMPWISSRLFDTAAPLLAEIKGANAAERLEIWNAVSEKIFMKPWAGWGLEASRHFKDLDLHNLYFKRETILHPHNMALQSWVEFGILGATLAAFACIFTLERIARLPLNEQRSATALFVTVFTVMLVGYGTWQGWWLGALFLSITSLTMTQKKNPSA